MRTVCNIASSVVQLTCHSPPGLAFSRRPTQSSRAPPAARPHPPPPPPPLPPARSTAIQLPLNEPCTCSLISILLAAAGASTADARSKPSVFPIHVKPTATAHAGGGAKASSSSSVSGSNSGYFYASSKCSSSSYSSAMVNSAGKYAAQGPCPIQTRPLGGARRPSRFPIYTVPMCQPVLPAVTRLGSCAPPLYTTWISTCACRTVCMQCTRPWHLRCRRL